MSNSYVKAVFVMIASFVSVSCNVPFLLYTYATQITREPVIYHVFRFL
jgi:hypothetical protein